jgi:phosphate transport system substrate-binding protein
LVPEQAKDPKKGKIIADFLEWMLNDGQKLTNQLSYAPLPPNVVEKVKAAIKQIH